MQWKCKWSPKNKLVEEYKNGMITVMMTAASHPSAQHTLIPCLPSIIPRELNDQTTQPCALNAQHACPPTKDLALIIRFGSAPPHHTPKPTKIAIPILYHGYHETRYRLRCGHCRRRSVFVVLRLQDYGILADKRQVSMGSRLRGIIWMFILRLSCAF